LETLFLGACTAGATYLVGWALEGVAIGWDVNYIKIYSTKIVNLV
jgi:hypothetical protein